MSKASNLIDSFLATSGPRGDVRATLEEFVRFARIKQFLDAGYRMSIYKGFTLLLDDTSAVDREVYDTGAWEQPQVDYFFALGERHFGQQGCTFIDAGSYFGLYSLVAATKSFVRRGIAIDADRRNFAQLSANIFINNLQAKIEAFHTALSSTESVVPYKPSWVNPENRGGTGVVLKTDYTIDMRTKPLDSLLDQRGGNILMKLDVEGHETQVLEGARALLDSNNFII